MALGLFTSYMEIKLLREAGLRKTLLSLRGVVLGQDFVYLKI